MMAAALARREGEGRLRALRPESNLADFCSNDYLGFARRSLELDERHASGATGSRLISGNTSACEALERTIAEYHGAEAALLFTSGYGANIGLLSAVPQRGDTILYDQLVHASLRDGARLSFAAAHSFRHNDLNHLEQKFERAEGAVLVVVESLYSMDGDFAPLEELAELCERRAAALVVDEAHATGVCGERGEGRVAALGLSRKVFARVHTYGKALGCHGAAIVGRDLLRRFLINFSRPFIYTTALPPHAVKAIGAAYEELPRAKEARGRLQAVIALFRAELAAHCRGEAGSPIQSVIWPGNERVKRFSSALAQCGFDVRPIMSPTVAEGSERLRVCLHAFNSLQETAALARCIKEYIKGEGI